MAILRGYMKPNPQIHVSSVTFSISVSPQVYLYILNTTNFYWGLILTKNPKKVHSLCPRYLLP